MSNNSTLFVTGMNIWLNPIFPYFIGNDDSKNSFQAYHNHALRLQRTKLIREYWTI